MKIEIHIFVVICAIITAVSASSLTPPPDPETSTESSSGYHHDSQHHSQNQSQTQFSEPDHHGKDSGHEYHDHLKEPQWKEHEVTNGSHKPEEENVQKVNEKDNSNNLWGGVRSKRHFHIDLPLLDYGHEHGHHHHHHHGYDEHFHHDDPHHHHGGHWHWHEG